MAGIDIIDKKAEYEKIFDVRTGYNLKVVSKGELISLLKKVLPSGGEHLYTKDAYLRISFLWAPHL